MELNNLHDVEIALRPYVPLVSQLTGKDTTLVRIKPLMRLVGNPEQRLRVIHIAGTSGKTSTSYYIAALLASAGQKVGLTVSPHVDKITERVQLNDQPLNDADFCAELQEFLSIIADIENPPSYFELLYAFALWVFDRRGVDYAVIETGMGGLHDATNVTTRPDKVCVLTDIGYDHMHVLGNTLPEIAQQKIGIVHPGNVALSYEQSEPVMRVFRDWTAAHQATLITTTEAAEQAANETLDSKLPLYQKRNWLLAKRAFNYVRERDQLSDIDAATALQTQQVQVPGRMEIVRLGAKTIVMDGAHNEQKMTAFVASFRERFPDVKPVIVVSLKTGKEYEAVSPLLASLSDHIIVTTFDTSQDLPARSIDPELFANSLRAAGANQVLVAVDERLAYQAALAAPESICIITGSFYLLSQLRAIVAQ